MDYNTLLFTALYVLVISIVLWIVSYTKGNIGIKILSILVLFVSTFTILSRLDNLTGYPSYGELPEKFRVHSILVDEPSNIFVWVSDRSNRDEPPQSFRLEYSKEAHKNAQKINMMLRKGKFVHGTNKNGIGEIGKGKGTGKIGGNSGSKTSGGMDLGKTTIFIMPPIEELPSK